MKSTHILILLVVVSLLFSGCTKPGSSKSDRKPPGEKINEKDLDVEPPKDEEQINEDKDLDTMAEDLLEDKTTTTKDRTTTTTKPKTTTTTKPKTTEKSSFIASDFQLDNPGNEQPFEAMDELKE